MWYAIYVSLFAASSLNVVFPFSGDIAFIFLLAFNAAFLTSHPDPINFSRKCMRFCFLFFPFSPSLKFIYYLFTHAIILFAIHVDISTYLGYINRPTLINCRFCILLLCNPFRTVIENRINCATTVSLKRWK